MYIWTIRGGSPFSGRFHPTVSVTGMPSAVWLFMTATCIWASATWRSKAGAMRRCLSSFIQRIFVSIRLRRWYPLRFSQSARPRCFAARRASFLAKASAVTVLHGFAFLRGGMAAWAPRSVIVSWSLRVSYVPSAVTLPISSSPGI